MGRPRKWSGETTAIRVPAHLAARLLEIAENLDIPEPGFVQNYEARLITINEEQFWLPPIAVDAQTDEMLGELCDRLLQRCKKAGIDPMIVFAEMVPQVCEPFKGKR